MTMGEAKRKKLSRDAQPEEILSGGHGPVQSDVVAVMGAAIDTLAEVLPGYGITLFISEPDSKAEGEGRMPRFNYMSNCDRADMVNMLNAFVRKNGDMLAVDAAMARMPEGSA
ncbi:hypothetical protein [Ancylobacter oerskovii]|uniref:Uncharacterized protein n=1 Tax=Ancylobacter oerskovii TaxID=459519 RepID=A0ABW4YRG4_9HYPH|nr:hypothetical protein [Ancylobacter oerskovii]MBS7545667.1 hypothetical protein [Ancylobacter oerskovii]